MDVYEQVLFVGRADLVGNHVVHVDAGDLVRVTGPSREEILEVLSREVGELPSNTRLRLHYLKNKVYLELFFDTSQSSDIFSAERIRSQLADYHWFGSVRVWVSES